MKILTSVAACLLLMTNAHAATVVIDFEDVALGTVDPISSRGFDFYSYFGSKVVGEPFTYSNSGNALEVGSITGGNGISWSYLSFSQQGLVPFDLKSFIVQLNWPVIFVPVNVTGQYAGGGSIQQGFSIATGGPSQPTFGAAWTNLQSVTIEVMFDTYSAPVPMLVDSITVSTVPVPAAVWLFASGLGLLGLLCRRLSKNALIDFPSAA
jgi:hypothetical protein